MRVGNSGELGDQPEYTKLGKGDSPQEEEVVIDKETDPINKYTENNWSKISH